jgi:hypothetical protein
MANKQIKHIDVDNIIRNVNKMNNWNSFTKKRENTGLLRHFVV